MRYSARHWIAVICVAVLCTTLHAQPLPVEEAEGQPLANNIRRVIQALDFFGAPLPAKTAKALEIAGKKRDAAALQKLLDPHVLAVVQLSPEARVKAKRGPAKVDLQQGGFTPVLLKIINESTVTKQMNIASPQATPLYARKYPPQQRPKKGDSFLGVEMVRSQPMTAKLSGLRVEYALALIYSLESGKREAVLRFDVGQGTQDLGFRGEVPVLFNIRPAVPVTMRVKDVDGSATTGRFTFQDKQGRVYPPQAKRLAPDFFFQRQIYRHDKGVVYLPPGELTMTYGRGPEYAQLTRKIVVPEKDAHTIEVKLKRWIDPAKWGWYSGDHHIHAAGCAHYTDPTQGVFPKDMFLHVKGEGLNVGCNLTWGPCFEFQRQFFEPRPHKISEPFTVLRYDLEISGFGSQRLGHVCLLNLKDQEYPGSQGTKTKGWPTWTTPLMRWAKKQGAVTGYAHSASGLGINPKAAAQRKLAELDANKDRKISASEAKAGLLPDSFKAIDRNGDGMLTLNELAGATFRLRNELPNLIIPEMNGIGAQEICVTTAQGLCDFISAMDTARVPEWNCWYHIMNCGFPLKASGETDFPCISGSRVGQGRVYVHLGKVAAVDFPAWCDGIAKGRSYVSDGYAHALQFSVNGKPTGDTVNLKKADTVTVKAKVSFASEIPLGTSNGGTAPTGKKRLVELIVNGKVAESREVPADDKVHDLTFEIPIKQSSWVALRHFPQMHTNPVNVLVVGEPIRASRKSAEWCIGVIKQLWRVRGETIAEHERMEAHQTFLRAIQQYERIAKECAEGS